MQRHDYGTAPLPSKNVDGSGAPSASGAAALGITIAGVCLIVPWAIFTVNLTLLSFSMHYSHPHLSWFIIELNGCFAALCGVRAFYLYTRRSRAGLDQPMSVPRLKKTDWWHIFFFVALVVAWCLGVVFGLVNYSLHMHHFYDVTSLATYPNVDPVKANGQQLLDAGRIIFTKESHLDLERASTFSSSEVYCVAPVVSGGDGQRLVTYDFWAVGTNCCQGQGDFKCGHALNPLAHAGTRLLDEDQAANYRLAVQQAEASYGLRAGHPLFLLWEEDPISEMSQRQDRGLKCFLIATLSYFGMQLFFVVLVAGSPRLQAVMLLK